jgi:butyryl-CoA dehydrogenase
MGFIEETGAAQYYRDARILTIYEGTTAIQANDLVGRKTARDGGAVARDIIAQVRKTAAELDVSGDARLKAIALRLNESVAALEEVVGFVVGNIKSDIKAVFAGSVTYLKMAGLVLGGWQMARAAAIAAGKLKAGEGDTQFYGAKLATARFFADQILPQALAYRTAIVDGAESVMALSEDQF